MSDDARRLLDKVISGIGGSPRESQQRMVAAVSSAIASREVLLVQAGTGTGKSVGYLTPILAAGSGSGPAVIATATLALQRQLMTRDVPSVVRAAGVDVRFALLKGRGNYLCQARVEGMDLGENAPELELGLTHGRLAEQAADLRSWALATSTGDRDDYPEDVDGRVWRALSATGRECLGSSRCPLVSSCFSERAREAASRADIVVTNHAVLALDAMERSQLLPEHGVLVIDEAHELVARLTSAATVEMTVAGSRRAASLARALLGAQRLESLDEAIDALDAALDPLSGKTIRFDRLPEPLVGPVAAARDGAHVALSDLASHEGEESRRHVAVAALEELHDVAGRLLTLTVDDVAWVAGGTPRLCVAPLSVSQLIAGSVLDGGCSVLTSATLTLGGDFATVARDFGLDQSDSPSWEARDVGTPFDYAGQGVLYVAADLPRPQPGGIGPEALARMSRLIAAAGGRTLVLSSSWRTVERVEQAVASSAPRGVRVLVQRRGEPVGRLAEEFAEDETSVLIGTMSLFQGVDVPGPACICVIIDRIPFPHPDDPVLAARAERVDTSGGNGFLAVSVPRAALLLAQGSGRLIRRDDDRGVVAVLDSRMARAGYARFLSRSLPPYWRTTDTDTALAALSRLAAACSRSESA